VSGHRHPFEESFFVLEGNPVVAIADKCYALRPHDFGLVPFGAGHAWEQPVERTGAGTTGARPAAPPDRWPRQSSGVFSAPETAGPGRRSARRRA